MTTPTHTTFAVDALLIDCDGILVDSHDAAAHA
jgi:beta-phosphoglucomutase-like phosphatase (HAD superfamily)